MCLTCEQPYIATVYHELSLYYISLSLLSIFSTHTGQISKLAFQAGIASLSHAKMEEKHKGTVVYSTAYYSSYTCTPSVPPSVPPSFPPSLLSPAVIFTIMSRGQSHCDSDTMASFMEILVQVWYIMKHRSSSYRG